MRLLKIGLVVVVGLLVLVAAVWYSQPKAKVV